MKKRIHTILILIAAVILWTGCTNEIETDIPSSGQVIDFSCDALQSRAQETTSGTIESFRVTAIWAKNASEQPPLMNGQFVEKRDGYWTYSPVLYMPGYGTVDFFAYSPANASVSGLSGVGSSTISLEYDVTTDPLRQQDLMIADALEQTSSPISLNFQHMLSSVKVEAQSISAGYSFLIHKVQLLDICRQGTLVGTTSGSPKNTTWDWTAQSYEADYTVYQNGYIKATTTATPITDTTVGPLMLLPQYLFEKYLYVKYDVINSTGNIESTEHVDAFPFTLNLEKGRRYTLRLQLSHGTGGTRSSGSSSSSKLEIIHE